MVLCSHGEGGGIRGSWRVARSRHRAVSGPRVQATWTRCQTHGNVGRNLWEVWSTYILSEKVNTHVLWWIQTFHNIVSSCRKGGFFVDLFVRVSNQVAVNMYKRLGYSVYRTVIEYYSASNGEPDEDAYGESARVVILLFWVAAETWITCAAHDSELHHGFISCICQSEQEGALQRLHSWEIAFAVADMRKALSRDTEKKSIIPLPHPVRPEDIE